MAARINMPESTLMEILCRYLVEIEAYGLDDAFNRACEILNRLRIGGS